MADDDDDNVVEAPSSSQKKPMGGTPKAKAKKNDEDPADNDVDEEASESGESNNNSAPADDDDNVANDDVNDADIENKDKNATGETNGKKKKAAPSSAKKNNKKNSSGTNKSYLELVHEAIVALKDRKGSSQQAVMKYLAAQYPNLQTATPTNRFKQHVLTALKSGVKSTRFERVKNSFKINAEWKKKEAAAKKRKKAAELKKKKDREQQKKKDADAAKKAKLKEKEQQKKEEEEKKKKDPVQAKIDMLKAKDPNSKELKKLLAERKRKEEAAARKVYIDQQLKKRRYPIEDTRLHAEDKEWGVKPPQDVEKAPQLPPFFSLTQHTGRSNSSNKYSVAASKCEGLEKDTRGLVSDLLQVYHFFRGDVGGALDSQDNNIVPEFTLKQLIYCCDDILSGTAKKARMVPPLIVHLFVTCLQVLTLHPDDDGGASIEDSHQRRQLQQDFGIHLHGTVSPTTWSDVCFLYMNAMHGHLTSEASTGKNVLPGLPIDSDYLLEITDEEKDMEATEMTDGDEEGEADKPRIKLPNGYVGYLGDPEGVLFRAYQKLERQDPWMLPADELMALLRALTDDVLARKPEIGEDIEGRGDKMYELLRAKREADAKFRKVRLAFEGPKRPTKKKPTSTDETKSEKENNTENGKAEEENNADGSKNSSPKAKSEEWKPTATKKQFERAAKAAQKANDAYEKGIRKLTARTVPVGYDRHFNALYCFRHDPEVLYVENLRPPSSSELELPEELRPRRTFWTVIEKKSLCDQFTESLDARGQRERALREELTGQQSLRRYLFDDIKERARVAAERKEKEELFRRLELAQKKCDEEEGRRSGRLAGRAEDEMAQIKLEIEKLEEKEKNGAVIEDLDYVELTGLELLRKYDSGGKIETRSTRGKKAAAIEKNTFQSMQCSKLCSTGNIDGTGFMGMLVSKMLELEESCEMLIPWERTDITRQNWISELENIVFAWNAASPVLVGPVDSSHNVSSPSAVASTPGSNKKRASTGNFSDSSKRFKSEDGVSSPVSQSTLTVSQAIAKLRQPLLYLEKRVYQLAGLDVAAQDQKDADDNMSTASDEEGENAEKEKRAWKKLINKLRNVPSRKHAAIRELVVDAIAAARKAHQKLVVGQLRAALLEFHPNAAGACKTAAIKVLDEHGGYEMDEDEEDEDEEEEEEEANDEKPDTEQEQEIPSALVADAIYINSSLDGMEDSDHLQWRQSVRDARTLSRMASLVIAFVKKAKTKLGKAREEHDALINAVTVWEKEEERRARNEAKNGGDGGGGSSKPKKKSDSLGVSEVWANVDFMDDMCMVMVNPYPWWPSKKCVAKDARLEESLKSVNRCLVSLVGESGAIRVVDTADVRPFTGKLVEEEEGIDMSDLTKETKTQLDDCMAMARRVIRAKESKKKSKRK